MGEAHLINCIFHMAQIIYTNGKTTDVYPKNDTDFSLEELQAVVGGYIELVFSWVTRFLSLTKKASYTVCR